MLLRKPKAKQGTLFKMMSEKKDCIRCLEKNAKILQLESQVNKLKDQLDHVKSISGIYKSFSKQDKCQKVKVHMVKKLVDQKKEKLPKKEKNNIAILLFIH